MKLYLFIWGIFLFMSKFDKNLFKCCLTKTIFFNRHLLASCKEIKKKIDIDTEAFVWLLTLLPSSKDLNVSARDVMLSCAIPKMIRSSKLSCTWADENSLWIKAVKSSFLWARDTSTSSVEADPLVSEDKLFSFSSRRYPLPYRFFKCWPVPKHLSKIELIVYQSGSFCICEF